MRRHAERGLAIPLSVRGEASARAIADTTYSLVVSSPLDRAKRTAELIGGRLDAAEPGLLPDIGGAQVFGAMETLAEDRDLWRALRDPRVLALGLVLFGATCALYGITLWLPQIIRAMGFSNTATGFVVTLPYMAGIIAMIAWGRSSDAKGERIWHVALPALLASAGFMGASLAQSDMLVLLALILAMVGVLAAFGPVFALPSSFLHGTAAAGGIALVNAIGVLGGFLGPYVIGVLKEQTGGYASAMAMLAMVLVLSAVTVLVLGRAMAPRPLAIKPTI